MIAPKSLQGGSADQSLLPVHADGRGSVGLAQLVTGNCPNHSGCRAQAVHWDTQELKGATTTKRSGKAVTTAHVEQARACPPPAPSAFSLCSLQRPPPPSTLIGCPSPRGRAQKCSAADQTPVSSPPQPLSSLPFLLQTGAALGLSQSRRRLQLPASSAGGPLHHPGPPAPRRPASRCRPGVGVPRSEDEAARRGRYANERGGAAVERKRRPPLLLRREG